MQREKANKPINFFYFSDQLKEKFTNVTKYRLTTVVGAMGYGKTTAARYLIPKKNSEILWQTVLCGNEGDFWADFCAVLSPLNPEISESLLNMGIPYDGVLFREFSKLFFELCRAVKKSIILVIDDFHLIDSNKVYDFLCSAVKSGAENFHLVVCSRSRILKEDSDLLLGNRTNAITADMLCFSRDDIKAYFKHCGAEIDDEKSGAVLDRTEGWVSLVYLNMLEYMKNNKFSENRDIPLLVKRTVYEPMSEMAKSLLLKLCPAADFTKEAADYLYGADTEKLLSDMVSRNSFIFLSDSESVYHIHRILLSCINDEFVKLPEKERTSILRNYAAFLMSKSEYVHAMSIYAELGDHEKMLEALSIDKGVGLAFEHKDMLIKYIDDCPPELKRRKHFAMLVYTRKMFSFNERERLSRGCAELIASINEDPEMDEKEKRHLIGECELLMSFTAYNSIAEMSKHHRKACELMSTPSRLFEQKGFWTFGSPSVLYMFYRESGKLDDYVEDMKVSMPYYYRLTSKHGCGAEHIMEAEMFFNRGERQQAEISMFKALDTTRTNYSSGVSVCVSFLQMKMALADGNGKKLSSLIEITKREALEKKAYMFLHTLDLCESWIYALIDDVNSWANWILDDDKARLLFPAMPAVNIVRGQMMLAQKQYARLISLEESFLAMSETFPNLLSKLYLFIQISAAYDKISQSDKAREYMDKALEIALPDKLYMPFAENAHYIKFPNGVPQKLLNLANEFKSARKAIMNVGFAQKELSSREKQIAALVAGGKSNKQIGVELGLTENTVKVVMKSIFRKTAVTNRVELSKLF